MLPVGIADGSGLDVTQVVLYATQDGGQSWFVMANLTLPQPLAAGVLIDAFQALSAEEWLLGLGNRLYRTADAGQTWQLAGAATDVARFTQFMFLDRVHGWAAGLKNTCGDDCTVLLQTSDSGRNWQAIDVSQ